MSLPSVCVGIMFFKQFENFAFTPSVKNLEEQCSVMINCFSWPSSPGQMKFPQTGRGEESEGSQRAQKLEGVRKRSEVQSVSNLLFIKSESYCTCYCILYSIVWHEHLYRSTNNSSKIQLFLANSTPPHELVS